MLVGGGRVVVEGVGDRQVRRDFGAALDDEDGVRQDGLGELAALFPVLLRA